jgi:hypothetical protein
MSIDFESDAQTFTVKNDTLSAVGELGKQARLIENEIEDLEETLKERKESLRELLEVRIPEACQEIGMLGFDLADGSSLEIKSYVSASIPKDRTGEALEWLRDNGFADIIKNTVSVQFGRGEDEQAGKLLEVVRAEGLIPEQATGVHPQTLKGWVREMVEKGVHFPMDLFGAYVGVKAVIKSKTK